MILLRALGNAEIDTGVATLSPSQEIVFAAALYLVLERGKRVSRAHLASLLWPRAAEKTRSHRLRQTILQLKKLGIIANANRDTLQLSQHDARSDVDELSAVDAVSALKYDSLEFLPGYNPRASEALRDWVDTRRGEAHAIATRILVRELERARLQADWSSVEKVAAKCLTLDAFNEVAVLAQAEAAAMRGGKRKAVSILDRYISEVGGDASELKLPATILRRRVVERIPDRPPLLNADPPFLGREAEMESLTSSLSRARAGRGSATLLIGEPGIGKSRLSAELGRFAELQGATVQRANCRRTDLDRPLSLFVDIVPQLREMPGALGCAPETFASLKRLTEFEQRPAGASMPADSEILFQNVRSALFDLFDSVAEERCLVILVEDVQWLDDASGKILTRMVEWCATKRVFFLLNCRPSTSSFLDYAEKARLDTITLSPLTPAASTALLQSIALRPGDAPEPGFIEWCLAIAEGNPFFLQELAHQWIETGHMYEAPRSVTKVLQERLSRLSEEALQLLQTCAVLGDYATIDRAEKVLEYEPHKLLAAVEELSKAAMLATQGEEAASGSQLQPRHDFVSSAAISRLASVSLSFIHRRAADVLENEIAQESMPATLLWASASHRHHAGDRKRALSLGLACAQHLLELGLLAEACSRFEDCLAYCTSTQDRLTVLPRLATTLQVNGQWERSKDVLGTCILLSSETANGNTHTDFELLLFEARYRSSLDFAALLNEMVICVESSNASPAHRIRAASIALKIASDVGTSARLEAIYSHIQPFLAMEEINPVDRLEVQMIYETMRGESEIPLAMLENFTQLTRSMQGEIAYSHALLAAASACRISGRDSACLRFLNEALDHALGHKLYARIPAILMTEIRLHVSASNFIAARAVLARVQSFAIPEDDQIIRAEIQYFAARIALEDRSVGEAEAAVLGIEVIPESYSINRRAACLAVVLRWRLLQRKGAHVLRPLVYDLEAAHRITRDMGGQDFETYSLFLGLRALGEEERARRLVEEYVQESRHSKRPLLPELRDFDSACRPREGHFAEENAVV